MFNSIVKSKIIGYFSAILAILFAVFFILRLFSIELIPQIFNRGELNTLFILSSFFLLVFLSIVNKKALKAAFYFYIILFIIEILWESAACWISGLLPHLNIAIDILILIAGLIIIYCYYPELLKNLLLRLELGRKIYLTIFIILILVYLGQYLFNFINYIFQFDILLLLLFFTFLAGYFYFAEICKFIDKFGNRYFLWMCIIIILGFIIRLLGAMYSNANLDEGNWIYDPWMISLGKIPFFDFNSREPFFFYFMAPFIKLFGTKLFYNRLISVVISTLNILVIYFLGKKIHSQKLGVIAAAIFSFIPYAVFASYDVGSGPLFFLITSLFFYGFLKLIDKPKWWLSLILGLTLGASVHVSRLAIFYYAIIPLIFIYSFLPRHKALSTYLHFIIFWLSSFVSLFPIMFYYISLVGLNEFDILYGFRALAIGGLSSLPLLVVYHLAYILIYKKNSKLWQTVKSLLVISLLSFSIYSFYFIGINPLYKLKIFYNVFAQGLFYLIPFFIFFGIIVKNNLAKKYYYIFITIISLMIYIVIYKGWLVVPNLQLFGLRIIPSLFHLIFWLLFAIILFFSLFFIQKIHLKISRDSYWWPLIFFFLTPIIFYLIHVQLGVTMLKPFIALGALIVGLLILKILEIKEENLKASFIILLLLSACFSAIIYWQLPLRDRLWKQKDIKKVVEYLQVNTKPNEEIFTAGTVFATESDRRIAYDISHPLMYGTKEVEMPDYSWIKNLPTSKQLAEYIKENIRVVVMDHRTLSIFRSNPDLNELLENDIFIPDQYINNNIVIYLRED
jgi:4-amino-4-deoxy-L-arabinose transferase-like glycosyltransferase